MKKTAYVLIALLCFACAKEVPPTAENINKIFDSKDFTITFVFGESQKESMSFRDDVLVYKQGSWTRRIEIDYDHAKQINDFVQRVWLQNSIVAPQYPHITISNDAYKTKIPTLGFKKQYDQLLEDFNLRPEEDVPTAQE